MEALWKPQPPGFHPSSCAESACNRLFVRSDPDPTCGRPPPLGLCMQEVTGSIPVGSTRESFVADRSLLGATSQKTDCRYWAPAPDNRSEPSETIVFRQSPQSCRRAESGL